MCVIHFMGFIPWRFSHFSLCSLKVARVTKRSSRRHWVVCWPERKPDPELLSVRQTAAMASKAAEQTRSADAGAWLSGASSTPQVVRVRWVTLGEQRVWFSLSAESKAWRERTDTNCLTDLHSVFMCPATVGVQGLAFERKHARMFNKPVSKFHCWAEEVEREADRHLLFAHTTVKGEAHVQQRG